MKGKIFHKAIFYLSILIGFVLVGLSMSLWGSTVTRAQVEDNRKVVMSAPLGDINVDKTPPTIKLVGANTGREILTASYVSEPVTIKVTDDNWKTTYITFPGSNSFSSVSSKIYTTVMPGAYTVCAVDFIGNQSAILSFCYDPEAPIGYITANGSTVENEAYINCNFSYMASDSGSGVKTTYYRTPSSQAFQKYTSGAVIDKKSGDGWYEFYCEDRSGNVSEKSRVFLEATSPIVTILRNNNLVFSTTIENDVDIDTDIYFNLGDTYCIQCETSSGEVSSNYPLDKDLSITYLNAPYFSLYLETATGITFRAKLNVVQHKPKITLNSNAYESGKTLYFTENQTLRWFDDTYIKNAKNTGVHISSNGNRTLDEFILHNSDIKEFTLETDENTETTYNITVSDVAENVTEYIIVIDKRVPDGKIISAGKEIESDSFTRLPFHVDFSETGVTAQFSVNGGEYAPYVSGKTFTGDAIYTVILTDLAGNKTTFKVTIDTIPPTGKLYADMQPATNGTVTNGNIYFTWDGDMTATVNGLPYEKNTVLTEENSYKFILTDLAGNSSEYSITIDTNAPAYNADKLAGDNGYLITKWYRVEWNDRLYTFATYDEALKFAGRQEFKNHTTKLILDDIKDFSQTHLVASNNDPNNHADEVRTGEYWLYKSKANPNTLLYYFDRELLDGVIAYYAQEAVSTVQYYIFDGDNEYGTPSEGMHDNIWTSENGTTAPIGNGFVFEQKDSIEIFAERVGGDGNKRKATYGVPFGQQFSVTGLYKITETDSAGNEAVYFIYLDFSAPQLKVNVTTFSDANSNTLFITKDSLAGAAAFYYKTFAVAEILDADTWAVLSVTQNRHTTYYTYGDNLPTLSEGGEYVLSVYDRLGNHYSFTVYIMGSEADIGFRNNNDDTAFTVSITLEQDFDTIVSLEIQRNGLALSDISTDTLSYIFDKAGEYTLTLRDNFGRTTRRNYTFHKSLPSGDLVGVENGGKTKTDVSFVYEQTKYFCEVYLNGELIASDNSGEVFILASEETSGIYGLKLINKTDEENFTEYRFTVNTLAPFVTLDGVTDGGTTNGDVTVSWTEEDITNVTYTRNSESYILENGAKLSAEGKYEITVTNDLGTQKVYTFTIDKSLNYTVQAGGETVKTLDVTNQTVSFLSNENLHIEITLNGQNLDYTFEENLTEEGVYTVRIFDDFGNATNLTFMIDKTVLFSANVGNGLIASDDVVFESGENLTIEVWKEGQFYEYVFGNKLCDDGAYTATLKDAYGNEKTIGFRIVKKPLQSFDFTFAEGVEVLAIIRDGAPLTLNGDGLNFAQNGAYAFTVRSEGKTYSFTLVIDNEKPTVNLNGITNGGVSGGAVMIDEPSEDATIAVYKDGVQIAYEFGQEIVEYGSYKLVVTDLAGNVTEYNFTLKHLLNGGAIALIVIGILAAIGGIATVIILRKKGVFGKTKPNKK